MDLTLDGGTAQQRQWFTDAVDKALYDWEDLSANVTVTWPVEPSLEGHQESACTHTIGSESSIEMRRNLDDPEAWPEGKPFYQETAIHELAHVMCFTFLDETQREEICPWFFKDRIGTGKVWGTAADLNPLDKPWEERIVEAMAEILKDVFLEERYRASDNRTYWKIDPDRFDDFLAFFLPSASPEAELVIHGVPLGVYYWPGKTFPPDPWPAEPGVTYGQAIGYNFAPEWVPSGIKLRVRWSNPSTAPDNTLQAGMVEYPLPESPNRAPNWYTDPVVGWMPEGDPHEFQIALTVTNFYFPPGGFGSGHMVLLEQFIDPGFGDDPPTWVEVTAVFPPTPAPEFPYKDSTVGSGGNDVGVIRLGPSLLT